MSSHALPGIGAYPVQEAAQWTSISAEEGPGVQGPGEPAGRSGFLSLTANERSAVGLARETFPRQAGKGEPGGARAQGWERQCLWRDSCQGPLGQGPRKEAGRPGWDSTLLQKRLCPR